MAFLRGVGWALAWLACGALGWLLLAHGSLLGLLPLVVFVLTGMDGLAQAFGK